jgi:NTP pyrophosphatase (non-canonical NTP hydrolase)
MPDDSGLTQPVSLDALAGTLRDFASSRAWEQFHTPKNLAIALSVEVGELLELMQWRTNEQIWAEAASVEGKSAIEEELADVLIHVVRLADVLGLDLSMAVAAKIQSNARRYPVDAVRGSASKRLH